MIPFRYGRVYKISVELPIRTTMNGEFKMVKYQELNLLPRFGLVRELSDRLYGSYPRRFRELVSNAVDADATSIQIDIDVDGDCITIQDDGYGMTSETVYEEFLSLGGSNKKANPNQIGRIGVGFLALASLGTLIVVESSPGNRDGIKAEINFDKVLDESFEREPLHEQPIGRIEQVNLSFRGTKITISHLREYTKQYFRSPDNYNEFVKDLRKILPLDYDSGSKVLKKLPSDMRKILERKVDIYWPSCKVVVNGCELRRYCYGDLDEEDIIAVRPIDLSVKGANNNSIRVIGYAIDAGKQLLKDQQGFITRVKNVAVEESGFLAMEKGAQVQRARVTGELHVLGLDDNQGINLDRTFFDYLFADLDTISQALDKELADFFLEVRERSSEHSQANKITKALKTCQSLSNSISKTLEKHQEKLAEAPERLVDSTTPISMSEQSVKDFFLEAGARPSSASETKIEYEGDSWVAKVPDELLSSLGRLNVSGTEYEIVYNSLGESRMPCEIMSRQVIFNKDHSLLKNDLLNFELMKVLFCLALAYRLTVGKTAGEMYEQAIKLLEEVMRN